MGRPCPVCHRELERVRQSPGSALNADQFDAAKAGDWWCSYTHLAAGNGKRSGAGGTYFDEDDLAAADRAAGWESRWSPYPTERTAT